MKEKVIFDTNFLLEKKMKNFFGKQEELHKFEKVSSILIPDIVIEELKARYKRDFSEEKSTFLNKLLNNVVNHNIEEVNIDEIIQTLTDKENIRYEIIKLKNPNALYQIKNLAIKKEPPFVSKNGSDKGFKDAYIYFTVLEYLQNTSDKYLFFITTDSLLKAAFEEHLNVIVVKDYDEFVKNSIIQVYDDYFINKLKEEFTSNSISAKNIIDYWININENRVILLNVDEEDYVVEVDSGEIIDFTQKSDFSVDELVNSGSFEMTHIAVANLNKYINYLSDDEIINILEATITNSQIIDDKDVQDFIGTLYKAKKELLGNDVGKELEENFL